MKVLAPPFQWMILLGAGSLLVTQPGFVAMRSVPVLGLPKAEIRMKLDVDRLAKTVCCEARGCNLSNS